MKKIIATLGLIALSGAAAQASVTLNGVAFLNAPQIAVNDVAYFIVDVNGAGFAGITFTAGENISLASAYADAASYVVLGTKTASLAGANTILSGAFAGVNLADGVSTGDRFAAVVFSTSSSTAIAGDTYTIWSDPTWVIPADGSTLSYQGTPTGSNFKQLGVSASPILSGVVVPEPSSFAALAGFAVLGLAASRRRRA